MDRRTFLIGGTASVAVAGAAGAAAGARFAQRQKFRAKATAKSAEKVNSDMPNVLFISLDDCNDWVGFLGNHPGTVTPNLDALARESLSFNHAYCTAALCLPARVGVMFGKQPWEVGVYDHSTQSRDKAKAMENNSKCLIDDFRSVGYDAFGGGKVYHGSLKSRWTEYTYTRYYTAGGGTDWKSPDANYDKNWLSPYDHKPIGDGKSYQKWMVDFGPSGKDAKDDPDGVTAEWVRQHLNRDHPRPFFIGWGITATHVPWRIPQRFFDMHPLEQIVVPEIRPGDLDDLGPLAKQTADQNVFAQLQKSGEWPAAVQAYQAAQSFMDDRLGTILNDLKNSKYADNTIVVVWSDHGFHLGEKMHVHKYTLWERATRVPFLLHVPKRFADAKTFDAPVSMIDLAPTLAELCGYRLTRPQSGKSLLPVIDRPELADERPPIMTRDAGNHSVRRGPWRYTRYRTGEAELYDHRTDPEEYTNLVDKKELRATIDELAKFLPTQDVGAASSPTATADAGGGGG